jgi:hypothetical protein
MRFHGIEPRAAWGSQRLASRNSLLRLGDDAVIVVACGPPGSDRRSFVVTVCVNVESGRKDVSSIGSERQFGDR